MLNDEQDLYLKYDGLLLVDVFEKLKNNGLKNYGFCPSHYLIALVLSFMTKFELKPLYWTYYGIYLFFEKGIQCETSYISKRYSQANDKYLKSSDWKQ